MLNVESLDGFQITNTAGEVSPAEQAIQDHVDFDESTYWETENLLCWAYSAGVSSSQKTLIEGLRGSYDNQSTRRVPTMGGFDFERVDDTSQHYHNSKGLKMGDTIALVFIAVMGTMFVLGQLGMVFLNEEV